jgi:hypothetical protein
LDRLFQFLGGMLSLIRVRNSIYRNFALVCALWVTGCAQMKPIPEPPVYASAPSHATRHYPLPPSGQTVELAFRRTAEQTEVRLTAVPSCLQETVALRPGTRTIRHELAREDRILMWGSYAGAGLTAGLVGIGMARGRDPGRGLAILGLWGIPLAAAGGYQSWRSRPVTEAVAPEEAVTDTAIVPCPPEQQNLLVYAAQEVTAAIHGPFHEPEGTLSEKNMPVNRLWQPLTFQPNVELAPMHGVIPLEPGALGMIARFDKARETEPEPDKTAEVPDANDPSVEVEPAPAKNVETSPEETKATPELENAPATVGPDEMASADAPVAEDAPTFGND